jgi:hypothetical protein
MTTPDESFQDAARHFMSRLSDAELFRNLAWDRSRALLASYLEIGPFAFGQPGAPISGPMIVSVIVIGRAQPGGTKLFWMLKL